LKTGDLSYFRTVDVPKQCAEGQKLD